jgi:hypothetical protein
MDEIAKREAYLKGLQLKDTELEEDIISIRLEKQGVSPDLAKEVSKNIILQRKIDAENNQQAPSFFASKMPLIQQLFSEIKNGLINKKNKK